MRATRHLEGGVLTTVRLLPLRSATPALLQQWRDLAARAAEPNPFMEADLVLAAAAHLPGGAQVELLVVEDDEGLALVLPVRAVPGFRRVRVPALSAWAHDYCFLAGPLVRAGQEERAWVGALSYLRRERPAPWLLLPRLPGDGPVHAGLLAALAALGLPRTSLAPHARAAARRRPDGSPPPSPLRGVHLKGLRRLRRRLGEQVGQPVTAQVRTGDPAAVEEFLALEAAGWKGRSGTAMATRGQDAELLRTLVRQWPDRVQVLSLQAGPRVLAAQVDLLAGPHSFCFKTSYDESLSSFSPGLLLELEVLADFAQRPELSLLDSCAVPNHPMADRVFPDRRPVDMLVVPLDLRGRLAARATPVLVRGWSAVARRPMEVP